MSTVTRARLEPDKRREQILACAIELFGERPYAAVSTTEIATAAGVTRGLLHHYFGTKRGLYVEVVREMLIVPRMALPDGVPDSLEARIAGCVTWLLDMVSEHGRTFVAVAGAEGVGDDPEVEALLIEADDIAARRLLTLLGVDPAVVDSDRARGIGRSYGALAKGAIREWIREGSLTRDEVHDLLARILRTVVTEVLNGTPTTAVPDTVTPNTAAPNTVTPKTQSEKTP
ncbi:transcriptional regulator [Knoellia sinensis KCTC 19936]|uniref:Transcriptional regulator n=1 Tax=Knoellia sinensis KCTC 19936 TaxID=1385520 RepID=A0A0A0J7U3_9MICO|nr:TetR/AcrR family transcriptional regulator [Knoellia sinensis]KGN32107.1 transcriptional regulator [Knoellia sinensis KCTC 19936]